MRAALKIDQLVFSVEFNQGQKTWTVSWYWAENKEAQKLQNRVAKYREIDRIRPA